MLGKNKINGFLSIPVIAGVVIGLVLVSLIGVKLITKKDATTVTKASDNEITPTTSPSSPFSFATSSPGSTNGKKPATAFKVNDTESGPEIKPQPTTKTETKEEKDEDDSKDSIPKDNDSPSVDLVTDGIDDEVLSHDSPVYLIATVTDSIGGVSSVDFYINDDRKTTIKPRNLYAESKSGWDSEDADEATTKAFDYLKDKYSESEDDLSYLYRKYNKFDAGKSECDIKEGYLLIILGKKNLYEVRVSEDLDDLGVCYKSKSLNYNNKYVYLFTDDADDYDFYVKAYDTYGVETKSEKIEFELN